MAQHVGVYSTYLVPKLTVLKTNARNLVLAIFVIQRRFHRI